MRNHDCTEWSQVPAEKRQRQDKQFTLQVARQLIPEGLTTAKLLYWILEVRAAGKAVTLRRKAKNLQLEMEATKIQSLLRQDGYASIQIS